jgi:hypothetical protein
MRSTPPLLLPSTPARLSLPLITPGATIAPRHRHVCVESGITSNRCNYLAAIAVDVGILYFANSLSIRNFGNFNATFFGSASA